MTLTISLLRLMYLMQAHKQRFKITLVVRGIGILVYHRLAQWIPLALG